MSTNISLSTCAIGNFRFMRKDLISRSVIVFHTGYTNSMITSLEVEHLKYIFKQIYFNTKTPFSKVVSNKEVHVIFTSNTVVIHKKLIINDSYLNISRIYIPFSAFMSCTFVNFLLNF